MRNKDKIAEGYDPLKKASYSDSGTCVKIVIEQSLRY
jgi:hypothetical protein